MVKHRKIHLRAVTNILKNWALLGRLRMCCSSSWCEHLCSMDTITHYIAIAKFQRITASVAKEYKRVLSPLRLGTQLQDKIFLATGSLQYESGWLWYDRDRQGQLFLYAASSPHSYYDYMQKKPCLSICCVPVFSVLRRLTLYYNGMLADGNHPRGGKY